MSDTLSRWHADHVHFAQLLALLEGQFALFHDGGTPEYDLLLDIMYYMTHYSDVVHHPKEALVFDRLCGREERVRPQVEELHAQHEQLKRAGEELVEALDEVVNGSVASRADIEALARSYVGGLRSHMRMEEAEIMPLAAHVLDAADWSALDQAIGQLPDPVFGVPPGGGYEVLRRRIQLRTGPSPSPGTRQAQSPE